MTVYFSLIESTNQQYTIPGTSLEIATDVNSLDLFIFNLHSRPVTLGAQLPFTQLLYNGSFVQVELQYVLFI